MQEREGTMGPWGPPTSPDRPTGPSGQDTRGFPIMFPSKDPPG